MENIAKKFPDEIDFLKIYDSILLLSEHYQTILDIHYKFLKKYSNIIDLGCGTGNLILRLLGDDKEITGVDMSEKSLSYLYSKIKQHKNVQLIKGDITDLFQISKNSYDGVSSMISAHLVSNFEAHIKEAFRILKDGGTFILTARAYNENQEKIVDIVKRSLDKKGLLTSMRKDFDILCEKLLLTANNRSQSLTSPSKAVKFFDEVGFNNITLIENNSDNVMYTIRANK
ncbi:MAG: class I SAM-dependent methyltransferase [Flavobacteriaceae bacterium]